MTCRQWVIILGVAAFNLVPASASEATTITFDEIAAPGFYSQITPGGPNGQVISYPEITFDGGVVLSQEGEWPATTDPNVYATSDFIILADSSTLSGFIEGTFSSAVSMITLDVINGFTEALFTLSAYTADGGLLLGTDSTVLTCAGTCVPPGGDVGHLSVAAPGIGYFTVTSNQPEGAINFAIDTVEFPDATEVPEPTSLMLLGTGIVAIARRFREHV